ncbi:MAG: hypothetical protein ACK55Z_04280, partial [bacterium]
HRIINYLGNLVTIIIDIILSLFVKKLIHKIFYHIRVYIVYLRIITEQPVFEKQINKILVEFNLI